MIDTKNLGIDFDDTDEEKQEKVAAEMPVHDAVVAIVANPKSCESFYLIKNTEEGKVRWKMGRMISVRLSRKE